MKATQYLRLAALAAAVSMAACSGGSDGGQSSLTVSLMDAPVDDVTEVNIQISALWLKPAGDGPAIGFPLTPPMNVDLLELTEENAAILVDSVAIEPGSYAWLAMDVDARFDNVYDDGYVMRSSTGGMEEIEVPSGRVRLVSGFEVGANEAVEFLFDWDLRQGLVHAHGQPGLYLKPAFRVIDVTEYGALGGTILASTITDAANDCNADDTIGLDYDIGNVVYVFAGHGVDPDDVDGDDPVPVTTIDAAPNLAGDYEYRDVLAPGDYTLAFTCQAGNDDPETNELGNADPTADTVEFFTPPVDVTIVAGTEETVDF